MGSHCDYKHDRSLIIDSCNTIRLFLALLYQRLHDPRKSNSNITFSSLLCKALGKFDNPSCQELNALSIEAASLSSS